MLGTLEARREPKILVLNKVDLVKRRSCSISPPLGERLAFEDIFMISATSGDGVADLKAALAARVPEGRGISPRSRCPTPASGSPPRK